MDVEALLEEAAQMATQKAHEKAALHRRESSNAPSERSTKSRRRSRSPHRRDSERRGDRDYRRREDRRDDRGDYYRGGGGGRRSSVSLEDDYYRPGSGRRDRERARSREPEYERRDRDRRERRRSDDRRREPSRDRRDRDDRRRAEPRSRDHGRRTKTPELNDDERDSRTVFVQQLAARLRTKELSGFFESCGPVKEAQIVKDRVSGRSKGVGYVEFKEEESVQKALQLTGQKLLGIPIIVQLTEAEKNRLARTTEGGTNPQNSGIPFHRLYVGNIHFSIGEDDLTDVFSPFGELEFVQLQKEEQGRSKGYGFVQFRDPTAAKEALEKMNGFDLAGRPIRVGLGNDKFTNESTQSLLRSFPQQNAGVFGSGGRGTHAGGETSYDSNRRREDRGGIGNASALNDVDVGEANLANISRHDIMAKLMRRDEPKDEAAAQAKPVKPVKVVPPPPKAQQTSRCIVLSNMYDLAQEEELNGKEWKKMLLDEIEQECSNKFGKILHIDTDPNTTEVFVKFADVEGAGKAVQGLNGRYFAGRMITVSPIIEAVYNSHWSRAINK